MFARDDIYYIHASPFFISTPVIIIVVIVIIISIIIPNKNHTVKIQGAKITGILIYL